MLDTKIISIIKSTAPVLQEHGETLTRHFYKRMFEKNPEVVPFFNQTNQSGGTQQRALAGAIAAYAANIDNLGALTGAVETITQKHVSLQIQPEHYPIVGENLLASIKEVLGDAATDEIIDAWGQAYQFLADIFIETEKKIYQQNREKVGGWEGFKNFIVTRKEKESDVVTSFYLKPEDNSTLPAFNAGQYITVRLPFGDNSTTMRNYSLSDISGKDTFRISVKKEASTASSHPDGYASSFLHDTLNEGDTIELAPPCGDFIYKPNQQDEPLILLAGGIGITPLISILKTALKETPNREVILIYGSLNENVEAFKDELNNLANAHDKLKIYRRYSQTAPKGIKRDDNASTGLVTEEYLETILPSGKADFYFCGPKAFMINIYGLLKKRGIEEEKINFEFFGPKEELKNKEAIKAA